MDAAEHLAYQIMAYAPPRRGEIEGLGGPAAPAATAAPTEYGGPGRGLTRRQTGGADGAGATPPRSVLARAGRVLARWEREARTDASRALLFGDTDEAAVQLREARYILREVVRVRRTLAGLGRKRHPQPQWQKRQQGPPRTSAFRRPRRIDKVKGATEK